MNNYFPVLAFSLLILLSHCTTLQEGALKKMVIHGHRGSRGTHPENTIPSFAEAVKAGANLIELDLQLTKDDVLLVAHDPVITGQFCTDSKGKPVRKPIPIRTLTVQEAKQYYCGSVPQARFPQQTLIPKLTMPTFEETLQWAAKEAPLVPLNVEIKIEPPSKNEIHLVPPVDLMAQKTVELLRKYDRVGDGTVLQSFDLRVVEAAIKIEPKLKYSCLFEYEKNFCDEVTKRGAQIAAPDFKLLSEAEVQKCHRNGVEIHVWTVNEELDWDTVIKAGVDGIITDYPRALLAYLSQRKI